MARGLHEKQQCECFRELTLYDMAENQRPNLFSILFMV